MTKPTRSDIHQTVTDAIIRMLDTAERSGASFPWCRPGVAHSRPTNALSKQRYRGINTICLWATADAANYRSGIFATYKQWQQIGAQVRKGEKSAPIVFYKPLEVTDDASDASDEEEPGTKTIRMAKGYHVFNADQVDGYTLPDLPTVDLTTRLGLCWPSRSRRRSAPGKVIADGEELLKTKRLSPLQREAIEQDIGRYRSAISCRARQALL